MKRAFFLILVFAPALSPQWVVAADDKAVAAERREAQKQRQQQAAERGRGNSAALREFRSYASEMKREYQEKLRAADTDFRLRQTDFRAQRQTKNAEIDAEMQQRMSQWAFKAQGADSQESVDNYRKDFKDYQDKKYAAEKQVALQEHDAFVANETRKHELMSERDELVLVKAKALGLMNRPQPVLATPIGGSLTSAEERWNEKEQRDVERLYQNNLRQLAEFVDGGKVREWEIRNAREDFELEWQQKEEMHELSTEQLYFSSVALLRGDAQSQQELAGKLAELTKQSRMIGIKYAKLREQNHIRRNEERRVLLGR